MSSPKEYYWRKPLPQNPVILEDGTEIRFEDMGSGDGAFRLGYAKVDEGHHKTLKKMEKAIALPSGTSEGSKSEYDSIKKKLSSEPLQPLWREEISADNRPRQSRQLSAVGDKEPAQKAIEAQSATEPLPEDSKPKVGKRPAAKEKDEA
jgi:hypothetical protein